MTLIGRSPIGCNPDPRLNNLVHGHQIGCCDQGHEAGNELTVSLDPMIHPDVPVLEAFRSNVRDDVLRKPVEFCREVLAHFLYPVSWGRAAAQHESKHSKIIPQLESEFDSASQSPYYYARLTSHPCGNKNGTDRKKKNDSTKNIVFRGQDGSP